jgi:pyridinium-3,5-biscarboxylic acid mononucleotide sulfurtransferase
MGLPTWDKPAMACLASRIPYGSPIHIEKLKMVEEAEEFLFRLGFKQVRARHHGNTARIELEGPDMAKILEKELREKITSRFRELGFTYVSLDLEGYVSGSMNRELK